MEGIKMKCPKCQTENPQENKFCRKCGTKLLLSCFQCGSEVLADDKFCGKCGQQLDKVVQATEEVSVTDGERKHVTVLFSDLSGYTTMSEKLDPEDVKEITSRIFNQVSKVINKYEGFVEKFVGDAVMALFGVPKAHEDDPLRAIKAAREIHKLVDSISPEVEKAVGQPVSMHTGINTGLVVTGEVEMKKGTHGVAGDTINLASRLSSLAKAGEVLVDVDTCRQAEGHFTFESLEPTVVKGKADPVQVHKVLSHRDKPVTLHRLSGLRAKLIGRKVEMAELSKAVENLREGKGRIFSICGDAGTGKSRLVEEFKSTLDLEQIQWLEGHAYAYSQNIPYFPLIDLLNRVFHIKEGDPPEKIRKRIESGIKGLVETEREVAPYVGSLYSLSYSEVDNISPEALKSRLQDSIQTIISALAQRTLTVFFLEDLHWADPSFVELLRYCLLEIRNPAIVLCAYRPPFSLFTSHQLPSIAKIYHEILLQDLSLSEAQDMLESLLKSGNIPYDLKKFVQEKSEGNPFYLEELVNSLIDSKTLIRHDVMWKLTKPFDELDISSTISGIISSRLDRLEKEAKRIIQEASVIGRAFLYEILIRVSDLKKDVDRAIRVLEQLDLIRTRSLEPDLEYIFKHAFTQEVVYNGLLKKERQVMHERIGLVMEQLFQARLPEFYEILAFHFKESKSIDKAVDYLSRSGEKSLSKSAMEESHRYFKDAFEILTKKTIKTKKDKYLLIDLLIKWAFVFFWDAHFGKLADLFRGHMHVAESLNDTGQLGMFYACYGYSLAQIGKLKDSYQYLLKALRLCEEVENRKYIGLSCAWLGATCAELGLLDEAIDFHKRGQKISIQLKWDPLIFNQTATWAASAHYFRGDAKEVEKIASAVIDKSKKYFDNRVLGQSYYELARARLIAGDFLSAIELFHQAIRIIKDPAYSYYSRLFLGHAYLTNNQVLKAEDAFKELMRLTETRGSWTARSAAEGLLAMILITKGNLAEGMRILNNVQRFHLENEYRYRYSVGEYMLGKVYLQMIQRAGAKSFSLIIKNIGFLVKNVPFASKKAEGHLNKAIEVAKEIGAKGILGQAYLDLGFLHMSKKKTDKARECISMAVQLFEKCQADVYLKQAKEALASLG
jgi:class 3 adenylate cyclase/tetratricopeptide (TPR) repeat protein